MINFTGDELLILLRRTAGEVGEYSNRLPREGGKDLIPDALKAIERCRLLVDAYAIEKGWAKHRATKTQRPRKRRA